MLPARRAATLYVLALLLLTALAFWPGLSGGFLFDDYPNIVQQEEVHADSLSIESLRTAADAFNHGPVGRPLATISFAVDHAIWGKHPWGYKLSSLLVHLANAFLVFLLVRRLLPLAGGLAGQSVGAAFAVALIWAVHPLQVSTVLYVVQRMETLSLTFVLLALLAYLRGRSLQINGARAWPWLSAVAPLVALGLFAKENALLLPAFTLALELTVLRFSAANPDTSRWWRRAYAGAAALAVLAFVLLVVPRYLPAEVYAIREFSLQERLLTQLRVLPMYLGWIVLPLPSSYVFYYDNFPLSTGLLTPITTLLGAVFLMGLAALAFTLRRKLPLLSLGILWFFASHIITSNVVPLEIAFEHRNYFAILGVLLALADLIRRIPLSDVPRIRPLTVGVVITGMFVITLIRSATWGNPLHLAMELAAENPGSSRASTDLGEQFMLLARKDPTSRFYGMAMQEFERGSRVPNASPMPEQGLIVLAAAAGQPAKPEWWNRIVHKLETRSIGPQELSMAIGLLRMRRDGLVFDDRRFADAYLVLVRRVQMPAIQYIAFGEHALEFLKDEALAEDLFKAGVERSRDDPEFVASLALGLSHAGHRKQAEAVAAHADAIGIAKIELPEPGQD